MRLDLFQKNADVNSMVLIRKYLPFHTLIGKESRLYLPGQHRRLHTVRCDHISPWKKKTGSFKRQHSGGGILLIVVLNLRNTYGLALALLGFGFFSTMYSPVMQTVSTENRDATPELASAVYSMMFGVGSILAFFVPVILSGMM